MDDKEIIEGNDLIARFMDWKWDEEFGCYYFIDPMGIKMTFMNINSARDLKFHCSLDALMVVLDKIEACRTTKLKRVEFCLRGNYYCIIRADVLEEDGSRTSRPVVSTHSSSRIEAIWKACIAFVNWYNEYVRG